MKISSDSQKRRRTASEKLRAYLDKEKSESIKGERRIYIELPEEKEHQYHITGEVGK